MAKSLQEILRPELLPEILKQMKPMRPLFGPADLGKFKKSPYNLMTRDEGDVPQPLIVEAKGLE